MPQSKNNLWKEYFSFSQKDRRAVAFLFVLVLVFALLPKLFPYLVKEDVSITVDTVTQNQLVQFKINTSEKREKDTEEQGDWFQPKSSAVSFTEKKGGVLFYFDPNTLTEEKWKQLGIRPKTIQTILNFRSKGGKFKQPEDLKRIYGLHTNEYERLLPYVRIEGIEKAGSASSFPVYPAGGVSEAKKETVSKPVDINLADTTEWKTLKGIGSGYSKRIVNFRTKLGGFANVEQVAETFGLPDSVFQKIKPLLIKTNAGIRQININTASVDELKMHPYIKYPAANAIIQYRNQHGNFGSVKELLNIGAIDELLFKKIAPYLTSGEGEK
jgi:competence protein ComEA